MDGVGVGFSSSPCFCNIVNIFVTIHLFDSEVNLVPRETLCFTTSVSLKKVGTYLICLTIAHGLAGNHTSTSV